MLRPRTVLRLVSYAAISWLVLAMLYIGLPSFSRNDDGTGYAISVLKSGRTLTRVYGVQDFFSNADIEFTTNNEPRQNIALKFRLDRASNALFICGTTCVPSDGVLLTRPPELMKHYDDERLTMTPISVPAGDTDGISLPWFDTADAVLMYHFIHRDSALVTLDLIYGGGGRELNIWPAGASQDHKKLLFSVTINVEAENDDDFILEASVPRSPLSSTPSPIYELRLVLLTCLAPLTIIFMGAIMGAMFIISTALSLLFRSFWVVAFSLLIRWLYKGRPPMDEFVQEVANDLRGLADKVQNWRNKEPSNRGKDEEQPSLGHEKSDSSSAAG
ncbi:uncharacterized protein BHQ10_005166 [Talaromyces amestolkiae]|uniref:Uncharacterized protein n=1 Tax=Talaromyces amestolkiae TaxID=1196081 RepID=A0A364L048_TALAM|nr:uncharacterized protein BHQ10_005166 [Talaromyces amestolkiae]RAO69154.1 hypothetical protein BHQ10_005166 [Talaromyces amestolkiae]